MNLGLSGKVALVTGASKGIGKAAALALAAEGAKVVLGARGEEDLRVAVEEIKSSGGEALGVSADIASAEGARRLVEETVERYGSLDILVNNAATTGEQLAFDELSDEDWASVLELNVMGVVRITRAALPRMREKGWGRIINVASESGIQPDPFMPHYNASKAALINLTKSLSKSCATEGILVNTVSPAAVRTPLVEGMFEQAADEQGVSVEEAEADFLENNRPHIEVKRIGKPEEVGAVIAFLASEAASFVNGANYRVDGGSVASV